MNCSSESILHTTNCMQNDREAALYAPHYRDGRFFCPWGQFPARLRDVLKWKLSGKSPYDRKRPLEIPVVANDGAYLKDRSQPVSVTWVGHSTFAVQDEG